MKKNPLVVCTELDNGAVLLNLDTNYYFNLNETGLRIWKMLDECQSPGKIAEKLVSECDVTVEKATTSVFRLIEKLRKEGLLISLGQESMNC